MNFSLFIAGRYLISKKSQNIINIISAIALIGIAGITAAMIIVLSAMNGLSDTIASQFNAFDPDIAINKKIGKTIELDSIPFDKISQIQGVRAVEKVIIEDALFKYNNKQFIGKAKGITNDYGQISQIDTLLIDGVFMLYQNSRNYAVVGSGVAANLSLRPAVYQNKLSVFIPKRDSKNLSNFNNAFNFKNVTPAGVFSVSSDIDDQYILLPYSIMQELLSYPHQASGLDIFLQKGSDVSEIKKQIAKILGPQYNIKDQFEQHELEFKVFKSEKLAVFIILSFILLVASFNIISALIMLIMEKREDMLLLNSLGAKTSMLQRIFLYEGLIIVGIGCAIGLFIGSSVILIQEKFGVYKLGLSVVSYFPDAYPVSLEISDFPYIIGSVLLIGFISTLIPVIRFKNSFLIKRK